MSLRHRALVAALAAAALPTLAAAQAFAGTGLAANTVAGRDSRWTVRCDIIDPGSVTNANCDGVTRQAAIITAAPGGWASVPLATGERYIGQMASGSVGNTSGENPRYRYTFESVFTTTGAGPFQLFIDPIRIDNYFVSATLNGVAGTINPTPLAPNGNNWVTPFTLTFDQSAFAASPSETVLGNPHTLRIVLTGNGATDGLLVRGAVSVVPEPSTYALMATGLAGLGALVRRRRVQA